MPANGLGKLSAREYFEFTIELALDLLNHGGT
jgi:hypothetical protein